MRAHLAKYWDLLRSSYWFLPAVMAIAATVAACLTLYIDLAGGTSANRVFADYAPTDAESAARVLTLIAGAMVTIISLVFSVVIVILTLASSQFGPRLLYTFMRQQGTQVALGVFVAVFIYSLLILSSFKMGPDIPPVPALSTVIALVSAVVAIGVLIFFIHHMADSIQAPRVIAAVRHDLAVAIDRYAAPQSEQPSSFPVLPPLLAPDVVRSNREGFLQACDFEGVLHLATQHDLLVRFRHRPGDFILRDAVLVEVQTANGGALSDELRQSITTAFVFGSRRTVIQDVEFALSQLVEIAVRALSPGINDPFTACTCIDNLSGALAELARREMPRDVRSDEHGTPRLVLDQTDFAGFVDAAFDQIRQQAGTLVGVQIRMLEALKAVGQFVHTVEQRAALRRQANLILEGVAELQLASGDRDAIHARYRDTLAVLAAG
ncbi:MAG: DUF2254 domain-containing protein [Bdellovibrionales bacterium]|nr:DUF2254 domain-containing protein [Bdellovibrionales bacterium]